MSVKELHFCLIGHDLGLVLRGELKQEANYMPDGDFAWVKIEQSPYIDNADRFGFVIQDPENDNAWTLQGTCKTREEAREKAEIAKELGVMAMDIQVVVD